MSCRIVDVSDFDSELKSYSFDEMENDASVFQIKENLDGKDICLNERKDAVVKTWWIRYEPGLNVFKN